ncbi:MAG TPA: helix-turn-helix transcriptional regulator [Lacibacter sp.]|nr:helix-turn-helix transcriptional regulator [Lacibacter sp.]HMO87625.1 helix-turn-helix transcriptional regulator [Lacibacter sp.]HMP87938.1 helix-turn-helix transcriptional regulator [Lacibacter sp.]
MFTFEYTTGDYMQLLDAIAAAMGTRAKDGWLFFPDRYADGYLRSIRLPNGLQVNIIRCTAHTEWFFTRKGGDEEYFTLRFDDVQIPGSLQIQAQGEETEKEQRFAAAYLTSSVFGWGYVAPKGTSIRGVNVLLPKEWLGKYLGVELYQQILPAYIALKARSLSMEPLDPYYQELMKEIMDEDPETPFPGLYVLNRVQLMMERFFNHIHSRVSLADVESNFKPDDIRTILALEKEMLGNLSEKPPSINDLSRQAAMSATKFKNLFKSVFGMPVYEYYQNKRMARAAELLRSGTCSVKQAGQQVGYPNVSNFSAAFKKHFRVTPHEFIPS